MNVRHWEVQINSSVEASWKLGGEHGFAEESLRRKRALL
jgi:hypothetical protein